MPLDLEKRERYTFISNECLLPVNLGAMMNVRIVGKILVLSLLGLLQGCDTGTEPSLPPLPSLKNLIITQTNYDSIRVQNGAKFLTSFQDIERISLGEKTDSAFIEFTSVFPLYTVLDKGYVVTFDLRAKFDSEKFLLPLTVRYHFTNGSTTDIDTMLSTLKYPFPSAELFITNSIMANISYFQDIDRVGEKFYYLPGGQSSVFEYDITTQQVKELFQAANCRSITVAYPFVFAETSQKAIHRYDLTMDSLVNNLITFENPTGGGVIRSMDVYNGSLYVLVSLGVRKLQRYTYEGEFVEEINYPGWTFFMTIDSGILYSPDYGNLQRFDLSSKTPLPTIFAPAYFMKGIRIVDGFLYYSEYEKEVVGRVPMENILTAPVW